MSVVLRSTTKPAIKRLIEYLGELRPLVDAQERTQEGVDKLRADVIKVKRVLSFLDLKIDHWQKIIKGLPADERAAEEQIFNNFSEGERHVAEWIDSGREIIDEIEILLANDEDSTGSSYSGELGVRSRNNVRNETMNGTRNEADNEIKNDNFVNFGVPSHLPKTRLPEFWGDQLRWPEFWQGFERTVDCLRIDDGLKAHYLLQCVRGKAKRAVWGYRPISEHYLPLKEALFRQFGNEKAIRETLHAELIGLPMANESVASLRNYLEEVERICRSLDAMGHLEDKDIVLMAIKNKLPRNVVLELLRMERAENIEWNVGNLRKGLTELVQLREEAHRCTQTLSSRMGNQKFVNWNSQKNFNQKKDFSGRIEQGRVFSVQNQNNFNKNKKQVLSCWFCQKPHLATNCEQIKSPFQRMKILSEQNRCLLCLKKGHVKSNCNLKICCNSCKGNHNRVVCTKGYEKPRNNNHKNYSNQEAPEKVEPVNSITKENASILLMNTEVNILSGTGIGVIGAKAFFDTGSTISFITEDKANELQLKKASETELNILPFANVDPIRLKTSRFLIKIMLNDGSFEEILVYKINKDMMPKIKCANIQTCIIKIGDVIPDVLISMKHFWRFFKKLIPLTKYLFKIETTVGPLICGEIEQNKLVEFKSEGQPVVVIGAKIKSEEDSLANFWSLEAIGVRDDPITKDDQVAMELFKKTIKMGDNGRYIVKWPWKIKKEDLPSNFNLAYKRFLGLLEKLRKTPELLKEYDKILEDDRQRGVLEITSKTGGIEHFLPHHPVISPKKIRIVYDASAHIRGGTSLNDHLFRGPIIMPDLAGLLIRFRIPKIAMWSDIEKAFHSLELDDEDREVLKLIWLKDIDSPVSMENVQYLRFTRVPFGVISSPFLLAATVKYHLENWNDPLAKIIKNNSYVDNILIGLETPEEAWEAYKKLKKVFKAANMNLREFISNDEGLNKRFPVEDRLEKEMPKILGIPWNINSDKIHIDFSIEKSENKFTKRGVLCKLASIFDPLGMAVPSLLAAKLFFQSLWDSKKGWDDTLEAEEIRIWEEITKVWDIPPIEIERRITVSNASYQLHVFSDASKDVYAACVYLRTTSEDKIMSYLVYARSRLKHSLYMLEAG